MAVPEFVLWKLDLKKPRASMAEWLERVSHKPRPNISPEEILAVINPLRGA